MALMYREPLKATLASAADFSPSDLPFVHSIFRISCEWIKESQ
jgi:hypothetical protein